LDILRGNGIRWKIGRGPTGAADPVMLVSGADEPIGEMRLRRWQRLEAWQGRAANGRS
jgi:hypothetical protein